MTTTETAYAEALSAYAEAYAKLQNCTLACADRASYTVEYYSTRQDACDDADNAYVAVAVAAYVAKISESQAVADIQNARLLPAA